jgi:hypothetical protein
MKKFTIQGDMMINPLTINIRYVIAAIIVAISVAVYMYVSGLHTDIAELNSKVVDTEKRLFVEQTNTINLKAMIDEQNKAMEQLRADRVSGVNKMNAKLRIVESDKQKLLIKLHTPLEPEKIIKYVNCDSNMSGSDEANAALNILLGDVK